MRPLEVSGLGVIRPPIEAALASARRQEAAGFDAIWWSDHFLHWFPPGVWTPDLVPHAARMRSPHAFLDPMPVMGAVAGVTERVGLGTAVTDAVRRHPALLAQSFLTLDHLSRGRALLGIGVGEAENIVPFGLPFDRVASRLIEAVEIIRLLWSTIEPVDFEGEFWRLEGAILGAEPYGERPPPIWMAAHRPRVLRATGRLADGWMPNFVDAGEYAAALAVIRSASADAGRGPEEVRAGNFVWMVIDEDRGRAERMLDSLLLRLIALTAPTSEYERAGSEHPLGSGWGLLDYVPTRLSREEGLAAAAAVPEEVLRRYYFWGTPDDVVERLRPFRAAGLEHAYLVNVTPLADLSTAATAADRTEEVLHGLRRLP
jgi:phthiodiolone/phenolphthiodiolone dimycocerosates ketoreductase